MNRLSLRSIITAVAVVAFAMLSLMQPPGRAYACSCVPAQPVLAARDEAAFVFSGTVSGVAVQNQGNPEGVLVTFDLIESWKGPSEAQLTLRTSNSSASCGYEFVAGERYLVYGVITDGQLSTNLCTRTAQLAAAKTYYWVDPQEQLVGLFITQYMVGFDLPEQDLRVLTYQAIVD